MRNQEARNNDEVVVPAELGAEGASAGVNVMEYDVTLLTDICNIVIPFLKEYNVYTARGKEFNAFVKICDLMSKRQHLSETGLRNIVEIAYGVETKKANRQFTKEELLSVIGNPQRARALADKRRKLRNLTVDKRSTGAV